MAVVFGICTVYWVWPPAGLNPVSVPSLSPIACVLQVLCCGKYTCVWKPMVFILHRSILSCGIVAAWKAHKNKVWPEHRIRREQWPDLHPGTFYDCSAKAPILVCRGSMEYDSIFFPPRVRPLWAVDPENGPMGCSASTRKPGNKPAVGSKWRSHLISFLLK